MIAAARLVAATDLVAVWVVIAVLVLIALSALYRWERYRPKRAGGRSRPTTEVFVDPETGRRVRVWVDPVSGVREYHDEPDISARPAPPPLGPGDMPDLLPPPAEPGGEPGRLPPPR